MSVSLEDVLQSLGLELIESKIGVGGSAFVHKASIVSGRPPLEAGTLVAVKEYKQSVLEIPGQLARIQQESEIGRLLQHENLIRTFGHHLPNQADQAPTLLLMEWIEGRTLESWYSSQPKPIKWETIRSICLDVIHGVLELHKQNVFHRDIKPENVMIRSTGSAVVMDIGVAEITGDNEHTLHTSLRDFVGSVRFASPQFILGEDNFTAADDVYSIGATFFLLFTGRLIYAEVERKPVLPIIVVNNPPQIDSLQEGVPASMKVLLEGCLHRDRKRRPTLAQLEECLINPNGAAYITKELELKAAESRSYVIIDVLDNGNSFLADLAGDTPEVDEVYRVVRPGGKIVVPSYNREVTSENWVAEAVLKHVQSNLGHFIVYGKRWHEGKSPFGIGGSPGQWIEYEKLTPTVKKGDLVLRQTL
jgi:serine/threonine protein kinase